MNNNGGPTEQEFSGIRAKEEAARQRSRDRIAKMIQRPDQLEKVEEYRKREARKKSSKEAMLKTVLQSQLDGARVGLELLKMAREDLESVAQYSTAIMMSLAIVGSLVQDLEDIRDESSRHSQYGMTMENMSNIFSIGKNLETAHALINDGNLLRAHIRQSELEASRDELLRVGNKAEQTMLLDYFSGVKDLSESLWKHLSVNLKRAINIAQRDSTVLVTSLRIIEREEKADALALAKFEATGFLPPGRFKKWKATALEILENSVTEELEACQLESRAENKLWLVRYLEILRLKILQNLLVVKSLCMPCFPPSYTILNSYVAMYHACLSKLLQECIYNGLEGNEYVSLLGWVLNTYREVLASPELGLSPGSYPSSLLDQDTIIQLMKNYLETIGNNYRSWRQKTMAKEAEEWWANCPPHVDSNSHFHTEAPIIIFQMVDENLQVAKTVNGDLVQEMLVLSLDMIREYGQTYDDEVKGFKEKYFEDRSKVKFFTQFMIAIVNNCLISIELAQQTKDRYWKSALGDRKAATSFEALIQTFEALRNRATIYLLDEAFLDLEPYFQKLTRNWLKSTVEVETICVTLKDYFQDYNYLKPRNLDRVMFQAKTLVAKKYLHALMSRKITLKSKEERKEASEKLLKESLQMRNLFESVEVSHSGTREENPFDAIDAIVEIIKVEDLDILSLELHSLVKHYPDMTREQLMALLNFRGDIGRFETKQKVLEILPAETESSPSSPARSQRVSIPQSIFSQIQIPPSIFP